MPASTPVGRAQWNRTNFKAGHKWHSTLQQKAVTWNDLPMELLVRIAKETIVPQRRKSIDDYFRPDEIETIMGAVDKRARQAFFEAIKQDCVFVGIHFHGVGFAKFDPQSMTMLDEHFHSRKTHNLQQASMRYGSGFSLVYVDLYEDLSIPTMHSRIVMVCCNDWNIMLVKLLILAKMQTYKDIHVFCNTSEMVHKAVVSGIVVQIACTIRDMNTVRINASMHILSTGMVDELSHQMIESQNLNTLSLTHDNLTHFICTFAKNSSSPRELLPLVAEAAYDYMLRPRNTGFPRPISMKLHLQRSFYVTAVFSGLADYLMWQKNTIVSQSHYLLEDNSESFRLVRRCIVIANAIKQAFSRSPNASIDPSTRQLLKSNFVLMQVYAEFKLALARAATLPGFAISTLVRRGQLHHHGVLGSREHLNEAYAISSLLSEKIYLIMEANEEEAPFHIGSAFLWLQEFNGLAKDIEVAVARRGDSLQQDILIDPMPPFPYTEFAFPRLPSD